MSVTFITKKINNTLKFDFIRFCIVGASGFLINASLLTLLHSLFKINIFVSQLIASEISLLSNFIIHDKWTYTSRNTSRGFKDLIVRFHATSWTAVVGSSILISVLVSKLKIQYMIALVTTSVLVLTWNYLWTKHYVWKKHRSD